jgi:hydroxyacylglutathione hydrolase
MLLHCFESALYGTLGYLLADRRGGRAIVIDAPQGAAAAMVAQANSWDATIELLLNTHGHFDHILDNAPLLRLTGARLGIHEADAPMLTMPQAKLFGLDLEIEPSRPDFFLRDEDPVRAGDLELRVRHCPGHSPGSVALVAPVDAMAFVGDVLFAGTIGRSDLPGGDQEQLLSSIRTKLIPLGDDVRVYPGHGPSTTIGTERRRNPFLT